MRAYRYFILFLLISVTSWANAQSWMHLRSAHIFGGSGYDAIVPMGTFAGSSNTWGLLTLNTAPINFRVTNGSFINTQNSSYTLPVGNVSIAINDIGGHTPGSSGFQGTPVAAQPLSTNTIALFRPFTIGVANARPKGAVNMRLRIPNSAISSRTWLQGEYRNQREYMSYRGDLLGLRYFEPVLEFFYLEVDALLTWTTLPSVTSHNLTGGFDLYRNSEGLRFTIDGTLGTTMPFRVFLRSTASSILKNGTPATPQIPLSTVMVTGSDVKSGLAFTSGALTATDRELRPGTNFAIGSTNRNPLRYQFQIPRAQLRQYYFSPGTYTIPTLRLTEQATAVATSYNEVGGLKTRSDDVSAISFTVPEMQQISIGGSPTVSFNFNSAQSYEDDAEQSVIRELNISSNVNYTVYVRAVDPAFQSAGAATIPLNVLEIGPPGGASVTRTVSLSNSSQVLIPSSTPVLDQKVNIRYRIPADRARSDIFGKPSGNYRTNVVFSFIAN